MKIKIMIFGILIILSLNSFGFENKKILDKVSEYKTYNTLKSSSEEELSFISKYKKIFLDFLDQDNAKEEVFVSLNSPKLKLNLLNNNFEVNEFSAASDTKVSVVSDEAAFRYKNLNHDPFKAIINDNGKVVVKEENENLVKIEELALIGILSNGGSKMALFKDLNDLSVILHEKDKIRNGFVKNIFENHVIIVQEDFDGVHELKINLGK